MILTPNSESSLADCNVFVGSENGLGEGILITCQYDEDNQESNTFGPLPLDFFEI